MEWLLLEATLLLLWLGLYVISQLVIESVLNIGKRVASRVRVLLSRT